MSCAKVEDKGDCNGMRLVIVEVVFEDVTEGIYPESKGEQRSLENFYYYSVGTNFIKEPKGDYESLILSL